MYNYKLIISYNGEYFSGWQITDGLVTVAGTLKTAIEKAHGNKITIKLQGASRTDKGVHAYKQCCNFHCEKLWDVNQLKKAINFHLELYKLAVLTCNLEENNFNSRRHSIGKKYIYQIYLDSIITPLLYPYFFLWKKKIDLNKLDEACKNLYEAKSLNGFAHRGQYPLLKRNYNIKELYYELNEKELKINFIGKGFFHHQIRFLVYHILQYSSNLINKEEFLDPILNPENTYIKKTLTPAKGLFLMEVLY